MANRSVQLQIQLQNAKSISDLELVLKEINNDLKKVDVNSAAFQELSETAKKADASLKNVKEDLRGISDEKQIQATFKLGEALAGSFAIATVASSAFSESTQKDVQEAIKTATQLTVVLQGLKPITEALSAGNRKAFAAMITGFQESALAAKLFGTTTRAALTATGIGAIIVGLGLIVAYWDDITDALNITNHAHEDYLRTQEKIIETQREFNKAKIAERDLQIELSRLRGDDAVKIAAQEVELQKEKIKLAKEEEDLRKAIFDRAAEAGRGVIAASNAYKEQQKVVTELGNDLLKLEAIRDKAANDSSKKRAEEAKKTIDKQINDEANALHEAYLKELQEVEDYYKTLEELRVADGVGSKEDLKEKHDKELEALAEKHRKEFELIYEQQQDIKEIKEDTSEADRERDQIQFEERIGQVNLYTQASLDAFNQIADAFAMAAQRQIDAFNTQLDTVNTRFQESVTMREDLEAQLADAQGSRREQILQQIDDERKKEKQLAEDRKKIQNSIIKAQNKANEIAWKNSIINSIVNTALGITNALGSAPPPANFILAALVGIAGTIEQGVILNNKPEPIPSLAIGGFTGIGGNRDSTGERQTGLAMLHENEWVAPRWMVENSQTGSIISQLESIRNAKSLAVGGFSSDAVPMITPDSTNINALNAEAIKAAVEGATIYASWTEGREVGNNIEFIEYRASA